MPAPLQVPTDNLILDLDTRSVSDFTLNGQDIAQWNDRSTNANHAIQSSLTNRPIYVADDGAGSACVSFPFNEIITNRWLTVASSLSFTNLSCKASSLYVVTRTAHQTELGVIVGGNGADLIQLIIYTNDSPNVTVIPTTIGASRIGSGTNDPAMFPPCNKCLMSVVGTASTYAFGLNSRIQTLSKAPAVPLTSTADIGRESGGGAVWYGDVYRILIYNASHDATQRATVENALIANHQIRTNYPGGVLVARGDSITWGHDSALNNSWPHYFSLLYPTMKVFNLGVDSATFGTQSTTNEANMADLLYDPNASTNILVVLLGLNDLAQGSSTNVVYASLTNYCATRFTGPWGLGKGDVRPITLLDGSAVIAKIIGYNDKMRTTPVGFTNLVDIGRNATVGTVFSHTNDSLSSTYYYTDHIHLLNFGFQTLAGYVLTNLFGL